MQKNNEYTKNFPDRFSNFSILNNYVEKNNLERIWKKTEAKKIFPVKRERNGRYHPYE